MVGNRHQIIEFEVGKSIADYIQAQKALGRKMYKVEYPRINMESTTFRYMVNGLTGHPKFRDAARRLRLAGLPDSIIVL